MRSAAMQGDNDNDNDNDMAMSCRLHGEVCRVCRQVELANECHMLHVVMVM